MKTGYVARACLYADGVLTGAIPACEYVKQACRRFHRDINRTDIVLDVTEANRWCRFLEKLPHVKDRWAARGELFELSEWQVFCSVNIFGFYWVESGRRRYRDVYIEVPRKNGKTFWMACIALGMLSIDGVFGAEVYCGATNEKQAHEVFRPAKQICERVPNFRERFGIEVNAKSIAILENGSRFEPIIGTPGDGASPSCAIADEYHEHKDSDQVDTMVTGMGARENPLMFQITTAGADMGGPCYTKRDDIKQILSGAVDDDSQFGIIYTIDEDDEWDTVEAQIKANPNYGVSVDPEFLKVQLAQARRSALRQVSYKTKHLNVWVGAKAAWMNMLAYQKCRTNINIEDLKGQKCFVALDLASKVDIASMAIVFPPAGERTKYAAFVKHYLPEDTVLETTRYKAWHADDWLDATPGNVTDFSYIEDDLILIASTYQVEEIPYDPFQATQFSQRMMEKRLPMLEVGATVKNFSEPMKQLEAWILEEMIEFTFDPVLMWMFGNVVAKLDKKDNIFPDKERFENKIDGVVAIIMAVNRILVHKERQPSIYELGPL